METIKKSLNTIGLVLIGLALIILLIWPYRKTAGLIMGAVGIADGSYRQAVEAAPVRALDLGDAGRVLGAGQPQEVRPDLEAEVVGSLVGHDAVRLQPFLTVEDTG